MESLFPQAFLAEVILVQNSNSDVSSQENRRRNLRVLALSPRLLRPRALASRALFSASSRFSDSRDHSDGAAVDADDRQR